MLVQYEVNAMHNGASYHNALFFRESLHDTLQEAQGYLESRTNPLSHIQDVLLRKSSHGHIQVMQASLQDHHGVQNEQHHVDMTESSQPLEWHILQGEFPFPL